MRSEQPPPQIISPKGIESAEAFGRATVWKCYPWAPDWFADARREAGERGRAARRREILFAACLAESYLLEFTLAAVGVDGLPTYFPAAARRGAYDKWRDVPKKLWEDRRLSFVPDFGGKHGEDWIRLLDFRDGLIHASAGRPATDPAPATHPGPVPSPEDLDALPQGWAVGVVVERIGRLHAAAGTPPPPWLIP